MPQGRVTLLIPTVWHRAALYARTLRYLEHCRYAGPIVVSDHSPAANAGVIAGLNERHAALDLRLLRHPPQMHFLERLAACAEAAQTPFVHLHADDDFLVPGILPQLERELERGCVAAMGLNVHLWIDSGETATIPKSPKAQEHPFARLLAQLESYASVLYALRRREEMIGCFRFTAARCPDVQFWQYLESCMAALRGPISVSAGLHYVRSVHDEKWSSTLVRDRSRESFPYLIFAHELPGRLQAFRDALEEACAAARVPVDPLALEDALVHLMHRAFGGMGLPPRRIAPVAPDPGAPPLSDPASEASAGLQNIAAWARL